MKKVKYDFKYDYNDGYDSVQTTELRYDFSIETGMDFDSLLENDIYPANFEGLKYLLSFGEKVEVICDDPEDPVVKYYNSLSFS